MTDTITTVSQWDATTPGGYALLMVTIIIAVAAQMSMWEGG